MTMRFTPQYNPSPGSLEPASAAESLLPRHFVSREVKYLERLLAGQIDEWDIGSINKLFRPDEIPARLLPIMYDFFGISPLYTTVYGEAFTRNIYRDMWTFITSRAQRTALEKFAMLTGTNFTYEVRQAQQGTIGTPEYERPTGVTLRVFSITGTILSAQREYLRTAYTWLLPSRIELIDVLIIDRLDMPVYEGMAGSPRVVYV